MTSPSDRSPLLPTYASIAARDSRSPMMAGAMGGGGGGGSGGGGGAGFALGMAAGRGGGGYQQVVPLGAVSEYGSVAVRGVGGGGEGIHRLGARTHSNPVGPHAHHQRGDRARHGRKDPGSFRAHVPAARTRKAKAKFRRKPIALEGVAGARGWLLRGS